MRLAPLAWKDVALVQPIATVGGAAATSSGAWVSDAASGALELVTPSGSSAYVTGAPHVYGLAPVSGGIVFDDDSGYGVQPDRGPAQLYPVAVPAGGSLVPGEVNYFAYADTIFLGGYASGAGTCTDGIDAIPGGGSSGQPYLGDAGSAPCGVTRLQTDSTGYHEWFGEANTTPRHLAFFTPLASKPVDYRLPALASSATPAELTAGPNGDMYFSLCGAVDTHPGGGAYMVRVNASSPNETVFSTYSPCANTADSMAYDAYDGRIWIANGTNTLTAVRASDGAVSTYPFTSTFSATSGFVALTVGPDRSIWAFRNGDAYAHGYLDHLIAADPSYAYTLHGQPVTVQISEYQYSGAFTASIVSGSSGSCTVAPVAGGVPQNTFNVASPSNTSCTVAFSDMLGMGTVYVPVVTRTGSNIPPQPQPQP